MMRLYLDLDGVITNFLQLSIQVCQLPLDHTKVDKWDFLNGLMSSREFWMRISEYDKFWEDMPMYPYATQLINMLYSIDGIQLFFCSSPGPDYHSSSGKVQFLRKNDFLQHNNYILTQHKYLLANKDTLLIDDSYTNCKSFIENGGNSIIWPQLWNIDYCDRHMYEDMQSQRYTQLLEKVKLKIKSL